MLELIDLASLVNPKVLLIKFLVFHVAELLVDVSESDGRRTVKGEEESWNHLNE